MSTTNNPVIVRAGLVSRCRMGYRVTVEQIEVINPRLFARHLRGNRRAQDDFARRLSGKSRDRFGSLRLRWGRRQSAYIRSATA